MIPKPNGCIGCSLHDKGKGFCPDKIAKAPKYVLIGEAPGKNEIAGDTPGPFVGKAGFVLHQWLIKAVPVLKIAMERGEVTLMNTLRCLPPEIQGRAYPRGEEKLQAEAHCRQYDNIPDTVHTLVLFGESPQRAWFGTELEAEDLVDRKLGHQVKGVMGRVGRVYERDGRRWVFAPHPAYILRQPSLVMHGQQALRIAVQEAKVLEVDYMDWDTAVREVA